MASNISDDKKKAAKTRVSVGKPTGTSTIESPKSGFSGTPLGVAASAASSWGVVNKPGAIQGGKK